MGASVRSRDGMADSAVVSMPSSEVPPCWLPLHPRRKEMAGNAEEKCASSCLTQLALVSRTSPWGLAKTLTVDEALQSAKTVARPESKVEKSQYLGRRVAMRVAATALAESV